MKINKAPQTHYFTHGFVTFSKSRQNGELYYAISIWKDNILGVIEQGKVRNEQHLKELQKYDVL